MSRVASFFRIASIVFRSRWTRAFLVLAAAIWGFDKLIFLVTQRSFFASVELESWFWRELWTQIGMFGAFLGICLLLTRIFLGALTQTSLDDSTPLRGILAQLAPLRTRVLRLSWALATVFALVLSREWASYRFEWIFLQSGARSDFAFLGIGASLWTHFLPVFEPFLRLLWRFSLALGILVLATGTLRALPSLASRNAAPPQLALVLWCFGAYLWLLRAALYAVQTFDLARGKALSSGDLWILSPLFLGGALACLFLCAAFLRRANLVKKQSASQVIVISSRAKSSKLIFSALAALFLPAILSVLSAPLRALLPETPLLKRAREDATRAAWQLPNPNNLTVAARDSAENNSVESSAAQIEQMWPVWDAPTLLASRGGAARNAARLVTWKSATLNFDKQKWSALLVGDRVGASAVNSAREADTSNALALERLDWSGRQWIASALPVAAPAFFGLQSRSLLSQDAGISLAPLGLKWAWAWRLRDPILPFDSQGFSHLMAFRGARERAQILAPFLRVAGDPQLRFADGKWQWSLDLCAVTRHFPGAPALLQGELAGQNAVSPSLQMRLDARTGAVRFVALRSKDKNTALLDSWRAAFPQIEGAIPDDFHKKWSASPVLLSAQAAIMAQERGETAQIKTPQISANAQDEQIWNVLAIRKSDFEIWQSAPSNALSTGPISTRGAGDLRARLESLDAAIAQNANAQNDAPTYSAGEPFVWRDARAPGGFWIARGFFANPRTDSDTSSALSQVAGNGPVLWRVAVTGNRKNARIGVGDSLDAAFFVASGQGADTAKLNANSEPTPNASLNAPLNSKAPPKTSLLADEQSEPLEVLALRTHEQLQAAVRRGDWKAFGAFDSRQTELLQRLAARRQNLAQQSNSTKNQSETPAN